MPYAIGFPYYTAVATGCQGKIRRFCPDSGKNNGFREQNIRLYTKLSDPRRIHHAPRVHNPLRHEPLIYEPLRHEPVDT